MSIFRVVYDSIFIKSSTEKCSLKGVSEAEQRFVRMEIDTSARMTFIASGDPAIGSNIIFPFIGMPWYSRVTGLVVTSF